MIWDRLHSLASAIVDEGSTVAFALHRDEKSWWLFVHEKGVDKDTIQLAWAVNDSLANAMHEVEKALEKRAREMLEATRAANQKLSDVLNEGEAK